MNQPGDDEHHTPRWVKVFGIVALLFVLLFAIVHLLGGGFRGHGPAAHGTNHTRQP
jgi:hypothetical protein